MCLLALSPPGGGVRRMAQGWVTWGGSAVRLLAAPGVSGFLLRWRLWAGVLGTGGPSGLGFLGGFHWAGFSRRLLAAGFWPLGSSGGSWWRLVALGAVFVFRRRRSRQLATRTQREQREAKRREALEREGLAADGPQQQQQADARAMMMPHMLEEAPPQPQQRQNDIHPEEPRARPAAPMPEAPPEGPYATWKADELRSEVRRRGLAVSGSKADLRSRLEADDERRASDENENRF